MFLCLKCDFDELGVFFYDFINCLEKFGLFGHSVVDLLMCLGSLSCCITQFQPSISCQTKDLLLNSKITVVSRGAHGGLNDYKVPRCYKTSPIYHPATGA